MNSKPGVAGALELMAQDRPRAVRATPRPRPWRRRRTSRPPASTGSRVKRADVGHRDQVGVVGRLADVAGREARRTRPRRRAGRRAAAPAPASRSAWRACRRTGRTGTRSPSSATARRTSSGVGRAAIDWLYLTYPRDRTMADLCQHFGRPYVGSAHNGRDPADSARHGPGRGSADCLFVPICLVWSRTAGRALRNVVFAHLSELRRARGHRLRLRRRGRPAAVHEAVRARAQHLQLLPPQRRRGPARVVVSPLGVPRLVPRRARHDHQRGPAGSGCPDTSRLPPSPGERIDRERRRLGSASTASAVEAFEGDTIGSALHASGRRVLSRSFKYHRPAGCSAAPASARTASSTWTAGPGSGPAPSRSARG